MTHPLSPNSLIQSLLLAAPERLSVVERVRLDVGPWTEPSGDGGNFLYFPEDALLGVSSDLKRSGVTHAAPCAWLGCHGVWSPHQVLSSGLQVQVMVAGWAFRVPEGTLLAADKRLSSWGLQRVASSQKLVSQMAQMSFCVRHHTVEQSLASWLLMAWHHSPGDLLQVPVASLQAGFGLAPETWQQAWQKVYGQGAVTLTGQGALAEIQSRLLPPLSVLACACHHKIQVN